MQGDRSTCEKTSFLTGRGQLRTLLEAIEISLDELRENWDQLYMLFYNEYLPMLTLEQEQADYKEAVCNENYPASEAFPGIVELIQRLKQKGDFLAVITSDFPHSVLPEIKRYGLENIFNEIIAFAYDKEAAMYDLLKKHALDPRKTFFVGDAGQEIRAGKHAGAKTIGVTWGFFNEQRLKQENPDFIVRNAAELEKILDTRYT